MTRTAELEAHEAKIEGLKRLILAGRYETDEMLEDAVDRYLCQEHDKLQQALDEQERELARSHPK